MLFRSIVALLCCFAGLTAEASLQDETDRAAERPRMARRPAPVSRGQVPLRTPDPGRDGDREDQIRLPESAETEIRAGV